MTTKRIRTIANLIVIVALSGLPLTSAAAAFGQDQPAAACAQTRVFAPDGTALPCGVGQVTGIIRAADTGLPLPNVGVNANGFNPLFTTTDGSGRYTFQYQTANGPTPIGLVVQQTGHYVGVWDNSVINVVSGTVTTRNFTLNVGATLKGIVHASDVITPLENVSVVLSPTAVLAGTPFIRRFTGTDASGLYQIMGLAPGSYKLFFDPRIQNTLDPSLNKYMPTYYGGAGDAASGALITVTTPTTLTANMVLTPGATIMGSVTGVDTGTGLVDYAAYAYSPDKPEISAGAIRYSMSANYAIQGLRPGNYVLVVYPNRFAGPDAKDYVGQYYNNQASPASANLITIHQITETVGVDLALQRGGVITGVVRDANTSLPVGGVEIDLNSDVPDLSEPNFNLKTSAIADASGVYTATGLPSGHYQVSFSYAAGFTPNYYGQVYDGHDVISQTVAGNLVTVTAPLTVTNINFALHPILTGTVAGRVTDPQGHGIQFVSVHLTRTDSNSNYGGLYVYTNAQGYYTTTMPTTSYFVKFHRDTTSQCGGCYNDQFYTAAGQSTPKAVLVTHGGLASGINATLVCGQAALLLKLYLPLVRR
jgi:hypothetical protein